MVNINPLYTARELEYALVKVDAKILVCPKEIGPLNYDAKIREMIPDLGSRNWENLKLANVPKLEKLIYYSNSEKIDGTVLWSDLESAGDQKHFKTLESTKVRSVKHQLSSSRRSPPKPVH